MTRPCNCKAKKPLFDSVVLINLERRRDRLEKFQARKFPLPYSVFQAVDGSKTSVPSTWKSGASAWGCRSSHIAVLEQFLASGQRSILVLEDDACWEGDIETQLRTFLKRVPSDWQGLWLGGSPQGRIVVTEGVNRTHNTFRNHAYAVKPCLAKRLIEIWQGCDTHIDHHHKFAFPDYPVYTPDPFLFGQDEGYSDISKQTEQVRYWHKARFRKISRPVLARPPAKPTVTGEFSHGGSAGDILYHLAAIKASGGGKLFLNSRVPSVYRLSPEMLAALIPLLEVQPYLTSVQTSDGVRGFDLDKWRRPYAGADVTDYRSDINLTDMAFALLGLPYPSRIDPWLTVPDPTPVAPVVIARTPRWLPRSPLDWARVVREFGQDAVFVGLESEWREFCAAYGEVSYFPTRTLLDAARVIAGARLVFSNQTAVGAITEGIKGYHVQETADRESGVRNCVWDRPGKWHELPADLGELRALVRK